MTFAILGATGATGSSILSHLLTQSVPVNVYVRSKPKLLAQQPDIESNNNVTIFQGSLTDVDLIASCIKNTKAVFLAVATNENAPGTSVAQDTSRVVLAALDQLQQQHTNSKNTSPPPRLVMLSAAVVDDHLSSQTPSFVRAILWRALGHVYSDLVVAEKMIRGDAAVEKGGVQVAFVKAGGLAKDQGREKGYELSTETCGTTFLGYGDLARAMIEVADADGANEAGGQVEWPWDGKNIGVLPKGQVKMEWSAVSNLLRGLMYQYMPWLYRRSS